jgi:hypothetical protein
MKAPDIRIFGDGDAGNPLTTRPDRRPPGKTVQEHLNARFVEGIRRWKLLHFSP